MPKITISEEDLTITNDIDVTANIVYVPGMTLAEVDEHPRLFESVKAFTAAYGEVPYKFASGQKIETKTIIAANEFEKSYIYAIELLTAGMPVYFQNIHCLKSELVYTAVTVTEDNMDDVYELTPVNNVTADNYRNYVAVNQSLVYAYPTTFDSGATYYKVEKYMGSEIPTTGLFATASDNGALDQYYKALDYTKVLDKWTYNVKFLTTGGYPTSLNTSSDYELLQDMARVAAIRNDAIALIDVPYNEGVKTTFDHIAAGIKPTAEDFEANYVIIPNESYFNDTFTLPASRKKEVTLKYATIISPAGIYNIYNSILTSAQVEDIEMPGSFGYLLSLANNVEVLKNPNYLAIAGVSRGLISRLRKLSVETTGAEADYVQVRPALVGTDGVDAISINPIVYVQNYGYCIWGNRTMFPNPKRDLAASSFLNIRVMSADAKKVIYNACQKLTFETNSVELWLKFKTEIEPLLDKMVSDGVLEKYELTRLSTDAKATIAVYVKLYTIYAVEDFEITVGLTDSTVEEAE